MVPRVLDDLPLSVGQRLRALWTIVALSSLHSQQLRRWRGRRWRLPARHPPAAQQPGGSQQRPGEVGSQGGGEGDGELRPHGGSWEGSRDEKRSREEEEKKEVEERGRTEEPDSLTATKRKREKEAPDPHSATHWALTPKSPSLVLSPTKNLFVSLILRAFLPLFSSLLFPLSLCSQWGRCLSVMLMLLFRHFSPSDPLLWWRRWGIRRLSCVCVWCEDLMEWEQGWKKNRETEGWRNVEKKKEEERGNVEGL